jgi:hypothetical protein
MARFLPVGPDWIDTGEPASAGAVYWNNAALAELATTLGVAAAAR